MCVYGIMRIRCALCRSSLYSLHPALLCYIHRAWHYMYIYILYLFYSNKCAPKLAS